MINAGGCGRGSFEASLTLSFHYLSLFLDALYDDKTTCGVRRAAGRGRQKRIHSSPATLVASHYAQKTDGSFRGTGWTPALPHSRRARFRAVLPCCR